MNTNLSIKFADWINSEDCPYVHVKSDSGNSSWVNSVKQNVYTFSSEEHKEVLIKTGIQTDTLFDNVFLGNVISPQELLELGWIYEDQLPSSMTKEQYNEWYKYSKIVRGVRMGERPIICNFIETENSSNKSVYFEAKEKIYISGKITGIENEAPELFRQAECALRERGYETVNPVTLNHDHDKSWQSFMREDVKAMLDCDSIYMMSNWVDSKGAKIEREIAIYLGLKVIYEVPYEDVIPVIKEVISVYGVEHQLGMAVEELGELTQAINKIKRYFTVKQLEDIKKGAKFNSVGESIIYNNLCSEVADVKIMIDQLEYIFSTEHINLSKERRLERLKNTINKEKDKRKKQGLIDYKIEEHE